VGKMSLTPWGLSGSVKDMRTRSVVVVTFPGVQPLDAVGPVEVFVGATRVVRSSGGAGGYLVSVVSSGGVPVTSESGLTLQTDPLPDPRGGADTILLAGGEGVHRARGDAELVAWLRAAAPRARRIAAVCTGAFLAAEAGLLHGRRATTHWASAARLAREFPDVLVDADPIYVRQGAVWTSAGVTAGIDLALALVQDDLGSDVAQTVARWLVMFLHRPGGQTQFASPVWVPRAERSTVRAVQSLVEAAPAGDHRLPALAAAAAISVRHFSRVFTAEVGETPARFVERVRFEAARLELEASDDTLDVSALRCGFGTAETLRRVFHRRLHVPPESYRRRFRTTDPKRTSA
jgi:transcriptional regulator GlxA family with amidase domain